jgi:peroxiredoxin/outer membrane lipoprotein-sorting protein
MISTPTPVCLLAQAASLDPLAGSWANQNSQASGTTQILVRSENGRTLVHIWGACHPIDCDKGEAEATLWNANATADWDFGDDRTRIQLVPQPDGRLLVVTHFEFDGESGPNHVDQTEFFVRQAARTISPDEAATRALLQQVAETYRTLPSAHFDYTETVDRTNGNTASRTVIHSTTLWSPPNKVRTESTGASEKSILIEDGRWMWTVYPQSNEFRRSREGAVALSLIRAYSLLGNSRDLVSTEREEPFQGSMCAVVAMTFKAGVTQELWIDKASHLVRKTRSHEPAPDPDGFAVDRETVYSVARAGVSVDPSEFSYDPTSTQAKDRTEITRAAPESMVGKLAPDFALRDLDGNDVRLSALRGKPVLLDFWATWCKPCQNELPLVEMLHRSLKENGLAVLTVDDEPPEISGAFLKRFGYTIPALTDPHQETAHRYHVYGLPTLILIDREGKIVFYEVDFSSEKLRDILRAQRVW